jgi:hypothetical protein
VKIRCRLILGALLALVLAGLAPSLASAGGGVVLELHLVPSDRWLPVEGRAARTLSNGRVFLYRRTATAGSSRPTPCSRAAGGWTWTWTWIWTRP